MYAIGDKEWIIYIRSFSKTLLPGLRLGMAIVPQELQDKFISYKLILQSYGCYLEGFSHQEGIRLCVCKTEDEDIRKAIQLINHQLLSKSTPNQTANHVINCYEKVLCKVRFQIE